MKLFLKKFGEALLTFFIAVLFIIFSPIILIVLSVYTVSDYFKYKKSEYYNDTHEKYTWMCASSSWISFYNAVKTAGIPAEYYRDSSVKETGYGYFVYNNTLLVCDYDSDCVYFDKDREEWFAYDAKDSILLETEIDKEIEAVNEFLGENRCSKAVIFIESSILEDVPEKHYERFDFLPVSDRDLVLALTLIKVN